MKISELIKSLEIIQENHGDLDIFNCMGNAESIIDEIEVGTCETMLDAVVYNRTHAPDDQIAIVYSDTRLN